MRCAVAVTSVALLLCLSGCGPALTRGPTGWHDSAFPFTITPLGDGTLVPKGWTLADYTPNDNGFRRDDSASDLIDLQIKRTEDDGALLVTPHQIGRARG